MSKPTSAYTILKEIGANLLRDYIYNVISTEEFDSHDLTNSFPKHFENYYMRMLALHKDDGDLNRIHQIIANRIGIYLSRNHKQLGIAKIGVNKPSLNMNGNKSKTSLWRKTE